MQTTLLSAEPRPSISSPQSNSLRGCACAVPGRLRPANVTGLLLGTPPTASRIDHNEILVRRAFARMRNDVHFRRQVRWWAPRCSVAGRKCARHKKTQIVRV